MRSTPSWCFFVAGRPVPQGSKRAPVAGVVRESSRVHAWRRAIARCAESHALLSKARRFERPSPVFAELAFILRRPKAHERDADRLPYFLAGTPAFPARTPDVDKLVRAALDGLTGWAFADDSQVVGCRAIKVYGAVEGMAVRVAPAPPGPAGAFDVPGGSGAVRQELGALLWWPLLSPI